jgi:hypothetical protein
MYRAGKKPPDHQKMISPISSWTIRVLIRGQRVRTGPQVAMEMGKIKAQ